MADRLANMRLVLFFTRGVSLRVWDEIGILDRELALYRRLQSAVRRISLVTYGDGDQDYAGRLGGLTVQCNRWRLRHPLYECYLRTVLPWSWIGPVVVKSNQVQGADLALAAARLGRKPFVARCGYLPSDNIERAYGEDSTQGKSARALERHVFQGADRVVVTTPAMRRKIVDRYQLAPDRVRVIPNYVDTKRFAPAPSEDRRRNRLLYVGRLEAEKNPRALFDAVEGLDVELLVVGTGSLGEDLRREARERRLPVTFLGNVPNDDLPRLLNSSAAFVMPSLIEGHPKALLEAMACGRPVIGTLVPGIRELIADRMTGVLCEPNSTGLRAAIDEVLGNPGRSAAMGSA
ncbi:MAG TPA: glycosyltransferase family 4 protein, partial [Nitrospira sp.]|nr:glycosyltransferase family 4 protein [Nitrospira sp.]